jgi:hypothetical protein
MMMLNPPLCQCFICLCLQTTNLFICWLSHWLHFLSSVSFILFQLNFYFHYEVKLTKPKSFTAAILPNSWLCTLFTPRNCYSMPRTPFLGAYSESLAKAAAFLISSLHFNSLKCIKWLLSITWWFYYLEVSQILMASSPTPFIPLGLD